MPYHVAALLPQAIESLDIKSEGIYVDATFGGGGHSRAILEKLGGKGRLYAFDQDMDAFTNVPDDPRLTFIHGNFRFLINFLRFHGVEKIDGLLADLGVSSHHFDTPQRGFSFREEAPLDMRMNLNAALTADKILNDYSIDQLTNIFGKYGEVKKAFKLAEAIVKYREKEPFKSNGQLIEIANRFIDSKKEKKELAQIFQALRIEVNCELLALENLLTDSAKIIRHVGRLAIISYHSLEDRLIKNYFKTGNFDGIQHTGIFGKEPVPFKPLTSKPIVPDEQEILTNPRSRSAKLRVAVRTDY